jgi:surface polysaccharide O-acyltransferase-like enzyme
MMASRIFLTAIGIVYLYLAAWCSLMPVKTSQLVGFDLKPGSGQSEFLVIYGGLEMALAVVFLLPLISLKQLENSLLVCLIVHACLVLFRSVSFFLYTGISPMTKQLAFYEWLIFLGAGVLVWMESRNRRDQRRA